MSKIAENIILNSIHNQVLGIDREGRVIVYNKSCERVFGWPMEEALGRHISEVVPKSGLIKCMETGKPHIGRKFYSNGALFVANRTPIIDQNGEIVGAIGVAQEITELQTIADELESVKELKGILETILEAGYEGFIVINEKGQVIMINNAFAELVGINPNEAIGLHISQVVENTKMDTVLETGTPQIGEVIKLKGREMVVTRHPIIRDGKIIGAVGKVIFKDVNQLIALADKVQSLRRKLDFYKEELKRYRSIRYSLDDICAQSPKMQQLKETIRRVARGPSTVLIRGESGTGKELIAHAIHQESPRRSGPFIKVNCAAVPETLLESELFGYVDGAFTGARKGGQAGKFELANGGTIFLDEIGDMPFAMQAKLLRVLQEKEIERLGDSRPRKVDIRIIAATNRNLEELIEQGQFRQDLYYRLNVVTLNVPPLRERKEDIRLLVERFIEKYNKQFGLKVTRLSPQVWDLFLTYHWPGNVRELENVMERAFNVVEGQQIELNHLPPYLHQGSEKSGLVDGTPLPELLAKIEEKAIREALEMSGGNRAQAAKLLGITRAWLYNRLKYYGIE